MSYKSRGDILRDEMNPDKNPLIVGGKAASYAEAELLASDTSPEAMLIKEQSPFSNILIPGSPLNKAAFEISLDAHFDSLCKNARDLSKSECQMCENRSKCDH